MHPSAGMGINRKFSLFLCCLIPIYGLSSGNKETKLPPSSIHQEYQEPFYSISILRPIKSGLTQAKDHLNNKKKGYKSSLNRHYPTLNNLKQNKYIKEPTRFINGSEDVIRSHLSEKPLPMIQNARRLKHSHNKYQNLKGRHTHKRSSTENDNIMLSNNKGSNKYDYVNNDSGKKWLKNYTWTKGRKYRRHDRKSDKHNHHQHFRETSIKKRPYFGAGTPSVVISQIDSHAYLPCVVHDLEDQTVSWIRNRDAHILTVNRYTFISGKRFVSWFESDSNTWTLQIKFINEKDEGSYECQLSTEPKMSHFVNLTVIVPKVTIPEGRELYVRKGSDISLKCVISRAIQPPPYVFWYHGNDEFNRRVVHQATVTSLPDKKSVATLVLKNADSRHAGNYTCAPSGISRSTSVMLHILNGEHPAAMQHGGKIGCKLELNLFLSTIVFCFVVNKYNCVTSL